MTRKRFRGSKQVFKHSSALYFEEKGEKSTFLTFLTFPPKVHRQKFPKNMNWFFTPCSDELAIFWWCIRQCGYQVWGGISSKNYSDPATGGENSIRNFRELLRFLEFDFWVKMSKMAIFSIFRLFLQNKVQ